jgi:hypothetical protein
MLVPKGGTACYQPLDRRIYGALKPKASAKFDSMIAIRHSSPVMEEAAAKLAQECWKEVNERKCP